jgi:hypothetical protein
MYRVNVSLKGQFFCEINRISDQNQSNLLTFVDTLKKSFPTNKGFKCTLNQVQTTSKEINLNEI